VEAKRTVRARVSYPQFETYDNLSTLRERAKEETAKVVIGQATSVELMLVAAIAHGHVLLEGPPGSAKTLLGRAMAHVLGASFKRIQFTSDTTPTDILGRTVMRAGEAVFLPGPLFSNVILADEINRTPPKTQAALLQAMQEYRVTAGGQTYALDLPFLVFATQNPIEQEGTYPLPEAQLDRFMFYVNVHYPSAEDEVEIVRSTTTAMRRTLERVLSPHQIRDLQDLVLRVPVADHVVRHAVELVRATRPGDPTAPDFVKDFVQWGAGPRASQFLVLGAKARAILQGRMAAAVEDVRALAHPVLVHRVLTNFRAESENVTSEQIVDRLLERVRA
jgi:MoxR-like ATPase